MQRIEPSSRQIVVVSGAGSGIGFATSRHLATLGYTVIAGVRTSEQAERLRDGASADLEPFTFDVTSDDDIRAVVAHVDELRQEGRTLRGIFSNAGIEGRSADLSAEGCAIGDLRRVLDVNYLGAVRFIQGFLPALRADRGTVVVNSALMARIVLPFNGGYAPSKAALESWCTALRREVRPLGVHVAIVELGGIATSMTKRAAAVDAPNPVYPQQRALAALTARAGHRDSPPASMSPEVPARIVATALAAPKPRRRYLGGGGAHLLDAVARLPQAAQDRIIAVALRAGTR